VGDAVEGVVEGVAQAVVVPKTPTIPTRVDVADVGVDAVEAIACGDSRTLKTPTPRTQT
jgi:hypothetical protein